MELLGDPETDTWNPELRARDSDPTGAEDVDSVRIFPSHKNHGPRNIVQESLESS